MKYFIFVLILFIAISCNHNPNNKVASKTVIIDDLNNKITLNNNPQRIISLAPNLTEIIYGLGLGDKLVGNTIYCDYPAEAKNVTKVGDLLNVDAEKVLSLKPDIVFITTEGNTLESYKKLKEMKLNIFVSNPKNYEGIKKTLKDIAKIFNVSQKADSIIKNWDNRISNIVKNNIVDTTKYIMFAIQLKPLIVAGKNTFLNEYIRLLGYNNIVYDSKVNYPILNREEVLKRNPDYIIYSFEDNKIKEKMLEIYPEWKRIKAIKNNGIITVDPNIYFRPGMRFVDAAEMLIKYLHH